MGFIHFSSLLNYFRVILKIVFLRPNININILVLEIPQSSSNYAGPKFSPKPQKKLFLTDIKMAFHTKQIA